MLLCDIVETEGKYPFKILIHICHIFTQSTWFLRSSFEELPDRKNGSQVFRS